MDTKGTLYSHEVLPLKDGDTVAEAMRRMLADRVMDLPVVDPQGRLLGMLTLRRLLEGLLPAAARLDYGMPDLAFVSDTLDDLRARLAAIAGLLVRDFAVPAEHTVAPDVSPAEIVMLLYKGANSIPVVGEDGRLVAVVTARDVLAALSR
jgi:CBS-domain-containing membrane protein